ncbi:MAG: T9SS type A sorting domain-containing protein, partial [Bacteroidota bacterium]
EAPSNDWFVSLAKGFSGQYDELSLKMSEPVVEGKVYELTYFELAADTFENNLIPPEIGLSADSLSFGTVIHTSTLTDFDVWNFQTFTFTAPLDGEYLTVRIDSAGDMRGWIFVDQFEIVLPTSTQEIQASSAKVYPNPAQEQVRIESEFPMDEVFVLDMLGRIVLATSCDRVKTIQLGLPSLVSGNYVLKIGGGGRYETVKFSIIKDR